MAAAVGHLGRRDAGLESPDRRCAWCWPPADTQGSSTQAFRIYRNRTGGGAGRDRVPCGDQAGAQGLETAGGRVLGVTAGGADLATAIGRAYDGAGKIRFAGMHYRRDIGAKGLKRYNKNIGMGT